MSDPSPFTLFNGCSSSLGGGGGGEQKQQLSVKLKDLIMKHPREKQTYSKQHENDLLNSSKRFLALAYGSKAEVINQH